MSAAERTLSARASALTRSSFGTFRGLVRLLLGELEFLTGRLQPFLNLEPKAVHRLVFVCLGNINRSAFGEAVACRLGARAMSVGLSTTTGMPAFEKAIAMAPVYGHALADHRTTDFTDYQFEKGDLLLVMEVRHAHEVLRRGIPRHAVVLLGHWARPHRIHIHDPHGLCDDYFLTCFTIIQSAVANLIHELRLADSPSVRS